MPRTQNNCIKPPSHTSVTKVNTSLKSQPYCPPAKTKHATVEPPIVWLSKRKNANGNPYLDKYELNAADILYNDFEKSQFQRSVGQNWDRFLDQVYSSTPSNVQNAHAYAIDKTRKAKDRFQDALSYLGYGLAQAALKTVCQLHTLETVEKDMQWPARSGKVIIKIALHQLSTYYGLRAHDKNAGKIKVWRGY